MKVTYNWLKDFVEIKIAPRLLADKLTMAGLEVTSLEERDGDFVFEIEVTSNRPDCLSVIGIAREAAAVTGERLKLGSRFSVLGSRKQANTEHRTPNTEHTNFRILIEDKKDCPLYTAKVIQDVKVGPSPDWLRKRLELIGCRSANNIVDITNYVLFEFGEPLHAFDLDKLRADTILVRRAKTDEKLITIDGEQRTLNPGILVIADKERAVAIAGVMGSRDTEVTESTKNILLEAAIFNPVIVRRGRQALGLQSESAYRFERGIDLEIIRQASWRAAELAQELTGGKCSLAKISGLTKAKKKKINLSAEAVHKIVGVYIAPPKIKAILDSLGFKVRAKAKNNFIVDIPSHRKDVNLEIDLIEEIARIFGFEVISQTLPAVRPQVTIGKTKDLVSMTKNILVGLGINEVITYSLIDKGLLKIFQTEEEPQAIEILNPLSKDQEILRPRLMPSLSRCVAFNLHQKQDCVNIFEIAKVFSESRSQPQEELVLGIALSGVKSLLLEQGMVKDEAGLLHLKGILEVLLERLGIKNYSFNPKEAPSAITLYAHQEKIGVMMRLPKDALDKLDIKNKEVFALEVSLDRLFTYVQLSKKFACLPRYPAVTRDISFIVKEEVLIKDILGAIEEKGRPLLRDIKIVDYYVGKQIPPGYRGLTISCLYRSDERTLTEAEINPVHSLVRDMLLKRFSARIR